MTIAQQRKAVHLPEIPDPVRGDLEEVLRLRNWIVDHPPVVELKNSFPLVLYFETDADRQEAVDYVKREKINLVERAL